MTLYVTEDQIHKSVTDKKYFLGTFYFLYYISPFGYLFHSDRHNFAMSLFKELYNRQN